MEKTHDNCKHYGYKKCPHSKDDVMRRANQETPSYYGGKPTQLLELPTNEEKDAICSNCSSFFRK